MDPADALARGRAAFERQAWAEAFELLGAADDAGLSDARDLERFAGVAYLTGHDARRDDALERAHLAFLEEGEVGAAVRCVFWLGMGLFQRGEPARASGCFARASRLIGDDPTGLARAYLTIPSALQELEGRPERARELFEEVAAVADRSQDVELVALSRLGLGESLVRSGQVAAGMVSLDEAMAWIGSREVPPVLAGLVYCAVIEVCHAILDLRRAREWTAALSDWCASQPDLVPYRGQCLVHRAEILQLHGEWDGALAEARRACERFRAASDDAAVGSAYYRMAELHRVRGEFARAERSYRAASRLGHQPQPGFALLRLAQGRVPAAAAAIRRTLDETAPPVARTRLLAAAVEIEIAADELGNARVAAEELAAAGERLDTPMTDGLCAHVTGALALAEGAARKALVRSRRATTVWRELDVPYELARSRVLVGLACRALGDADGALLEFDAARETFGQLGAEPDLRDLRRLASEARPAEGGLTERELQVLRLVARGDSNRAIARELVISEHTVARHLQNIFAKLGVGSRTAAATYAFEHELL